MQGRGEKEAKGEESRKNGEVEARVVDRVSGRERLNSGGPSDLGQKGKQYSRAGFGQGHGTGREGRKEG